MLYSGNLPCTGTSSETGNCQSEEHSLSSFFKALLCLNQFSVEGSWTAWGAWDSTYTNACGLSKRYRTRGHSGGGQPCSGSSTSHRIYRWGSHQDNYDCSMSYSFSVTWSAHFRLSLIYLIEFLNIKKGSGMKIGWYRFSTEACCDKVTIENVGTYSGTTSPGTLTLTGSTITVR